MVEVLHAPSGTARSALRWGGLPPRVSSPTVKAVLTGVGLAVAATGIIASIAGGLAGPLGWALNAPVSASLSGVSHLIDRAKNHVEASDELETRARENTRTIFRQLGIQPSQPRYATAAEFKAAADINPELRKLYQAPLANQAHENRSSLLTNAGMAAAGALVPFGGAVAGVAEASKAVVEGSKVVGIVSKGLPMLKSLAAGAAGMMAGQKLADALSGEIVDPAVLIRAIHANMEEAAAKGIDMHQVVTPQLIFALRVSQDPSFDNEIKQHFGQGKLRFHQMEAKQQERVMQAFPALKNAVTSEAHAVATEIMPLTELAASKPNLNSRALEYAAGAAQPSFASRVGGSRTEAASPSFAARLGNKEPMASYATAVDAQRAAIQNTTTVTN